MEVIMIEDKDLPEGWRQLDYSIFQTLSELEARIIILERDNENFRRLFQLRHDALDCIDRHFDAVDTSLMRLEDAYYAQFPERLDQDVRFLQQMERLQKPKADGDPKKS
jgi:hypothetical protein